MFPSTFLISVVDNRSRQRILAAMNLGNKLTGGNFVAK